MMLALHLAERAGVTYRQLSYWTEQGWLHIAGCRRTDDSPDCDCATPGSGNVRDYTVREVAVAMRMGALTRAWIAPAFAATVARSMVDKGLDVCHVTGAAGPEVALSYLVGGDAA